MSDQDFNPEKIVETFREFPDDELKVMAEKMMRKAGQNWPLDMAPFPAERMYAIAKRLIELLDNPPAQAAEPAKQELTDKQQEVLSLVEKYITVGIKPTAANLAESLGYSKPGPAASALRALEKKGYLEKVDDNYSIVR